MYFQLAIFDLDGTILDTLADLAACLNYALEKAGFPARTIDEVCCFVGNGIRKLVERGCPSDTPDLIREQVYQIFSRHYKEHCFDRTAPYAGIPELLKKMRASGILTAVVSNKADFAVQKLCQRYFPCLFDVVIGEREGIRRKPAPDSVNEILKHLSIPAAQAVYIGDSDVDIETGKNAGLSVISVDWGFRSRTFLLEHGAACIVSHPDEIFLKLLKK